MGGTEVRRSADRSTTRAAGLTSRHSFSFGEHYDPANTGHALLVAHNEDVLGPRAGYDLHPHRDLEIVTWVLSGSVVHVDDNGHSGVITPGRAQLMSAGLGIRHSERNDAAASGDEQAHFVQMWVLPGAPGLRPSYASAEVGDVTGQGLIPLASGITNGPDAAVELHADAALHVARLATGEVVQLPGAPYLHVFVARGAVDLEGAGRLDTGDAARLTSDGGPRVTAGGVGAELLVWEMRADRGRGPRL